MEEIVNKEEAITASYSKLSTKREEPIPTSVSKTSGIWKASDGSTLSTRLLNCIP